MITHLPDICKKHQIFWSEFKLSGGWRVAEWTREKSGHFWVKQHWERIVLGWEARLGTPGAASFSSFSRFLRAAGEIFAKQKLTSPLALAYKKFGGPIWTPGSHLTLTTGPGEQVVKKL